MLFGLTSSSRFIQLNIDKFIYKCVQDVWDMWSHYADTPRDACFHFLCGSRYEGILKAGIEVKAGSDECLAKCAAVARGNDTYL